VKEPNKLYIYETQKITRKASDVAEYIELFDSFTRRVTGFTSDFRPPQTLADICIWHDDLG